MRTRDFGGAMAVGALLRTVPYALLGQGLASGSVATVAVATASIALGGVAAALLLRQLRGSPGQRDLGRDERAAPDRAVDQEPAVQGLQPVA